jgi:LmbE family N-acetylglucosaminyl deacetylase
MEFIDFVTLCRSKKLNLLFPQWKKGEKVAFLSPHDDDVVLGAGYLLKAVVESGGVPLVFIFCKGDAGYSAVVDKSTIVKTRKKETRQAYKMLGVGEENLFYSEIPDFSLSPYINRNLPRGKGLFEEQVRLFRKEQVSRVVFSSGYYEHWDHTAVHKMGIYTSPQAGDPILADLGKPCAPKSYYVYSVWGDFEPEKTDPGDIRADKGILMDKDQENLVREAIRAFSSQKKIYKTIVDYREKRKSESGYLELYKTATVRSQIKFKAYFDLLAKCKNRDGNRKE